MAIPDVSIHATEGNGEGADPLTPIERMILEHLLKKQASIDSKSNAEVQPVVAGTKSDAENQSGSSSSTSQKNFVAKDIKAASKSTSKIPPKNKATSEMDEEDNEMSDGPLNDEELDRLMEQFGLEYSNFDGSEDDDDEAERGRSPPKKTIRGRGRGSKTNAGRGRGRVADSESLSDVDEDDSQLYNDPMHRATVAMEKMSDDQVLQYMETYKKEVVASGSEVDSDAFMIWLTSKLTDKSETPVPITEGKKFVLRGVKSRGRGRGRGPSRRVGRGRIPKNKMSPENE